MPSRRIASFHDGFLALALHVLVWVINCLKRRAIWTSDLQTYTELRHKKSRYINDHHSAFMYESLLHRLTTNHTRKFCDLFKRCRLEPRDVFYSFTHNDVPAALILHTASFYVYITLKATTAENVKLCFDSIRMQTWQRVTTTLHKLTHMKRCCITYYIKRCTNRFAREFTT